MQRTKSSLLSYLLNLQLSHLLEGSQTLIIIELISWQVIYSPIYFCSLMHDFWCDSADRKQTADAKLRLGQLLSADELTSKVRIFRVAYRESTAIPLHLIQDSYYNNMSRVPQCLH